MQLNCLIVDDEPVARRGLEEYVKEVEFLNLVGQCENALKATAMLSQHSVDLLFLDIQMPDLTGIELARVLEKAGNKAPRIIFTTAFNQYALDGFRVDAIDYLLKPFNYEEFLRAASKAQAYVELVQKASSAGSAASRSLSTTSPTCAPNSSRQALWSSGGRS